MTFHFRRKIYSDIQIVKAYQITDKSIQQFWYDKCRDQFGKGTSSYTGIADFELAELFQNSFILLWKKIECGQIFVKDESVWGISKKGEKVIPDLLGYFMKIVKNKYLELLHDGKRLLPINETVLSEEENLFEELYWYDDPEIEKDRIVAHCFQQLPQSCREILTMFYYKDMTLEEILQARPENSSYDGLKSRKSKCFSNLKKKITESFAKAGLR